MTSKFFSIDFANLSKDEFLRNDEKFHSFLYFSNWNLYKVKNKPVISLKEILTSDYQLFEYEEGEEYKGLPTGQSYFDEDGEITDFQQVTAGNHPGRLKYKISSKNILISSVRLAKSPALYFDDIDFANYVFSNGFYIFKVKDGWNKKFILYILRTKKLKTILDDHIYRGIGISAYKDTDLLKIKIPVVPEDAQNKIVDKIKPIERKIQNLKKNIVSTQEIINKVFAREFSFDLDKFKKLKEIKNHYLDLYAFSNNKDLRQSVKFHADSAKFVMQELNRVTKSKVKHFIAEPIVLGAGISPSNFDETGEYYYVSMATVKNYKLEIDETQLVSDEYAQANTNKFIKENDIIMTRSGVAIGKFALIEDDTKGVFADFTMRIRLKNYNHRFAYYYFRMDYFQHLIHSHKKGLQNQNIFPSQIQEFPIIDISLKEQKRIVNEIKSELDKQQIIRNQINAERRKIDDIIEGIIA